jgi:glutathione peroxidase-family protein
VLTAIRDPRPSNKVLAFCRLKYRHFNLSEKIRVAESGQKIFI